MRTYRRDPLRARLLDLDRQPAVGMAGPGVGFDDFARQREGHKQRPIRRVGNAVAAPSEPRNRQAFDHELRLEHDPDHGGEDRELYHDAGQEHVLVVAAEVRDREVLQRDRRQVDGDAALDRVHRLDEPEATRWTIEVDGAVAGMVQFSEEREPKYRHASVDLFLDPALHSRGLGTEAVRRVCRHLIEERGHHRLTIDPATGNVAAIRAYEKAGFKPVGVMRRSERDADGNGWHDSLLMELLAEEP